MSNTAPIVVEKIALAQIRPSQKNPRRIITQEMIDARAASMAEGGLAMPITLLPLSPAEGEVLYEIIDGEVRYRAALKLGWAEIEASITPMNTQKAFKTRIRANRTNKPIWFEDYLAMEELANEPDGPEKLLKQQIADLFEIDNARGSRAIRILGVLNDAGRALVLENLQKFTPKRDMVLENLQNSEAKKAISESTLYRLADLDDPQAVEAALRVVLDKQMTEPQAKALVASMKAGTPADAYVASAQPKRAPRPVASEQVAHEHVVVPKAPKRSKASGSAYGEPTPGSLSEPEQPNTSSSLSRELVQPSHVAQLEASQQASQNHASRLVGSRQAALPPELASQMVEMPSPRTADAPAPVHAEHPAPAQMPKPAAKPASQSEMSTAGTGSSSGTGTSKSLTDSHIDVESVQPNRGSRPVASPQASAGGLSTAEAVMYDTLAGVSVIAKIKTKLKKSEKPTPAETLLLAGHFLWTIVAWLGKHGFNFVKWMAKETWKLSKESLKLTLNSLGSKTKKTVKAIFIILFWALLLVTAWDIHERGWQHPFQFAWAKVTPFGHSQTTPPPATEQTQTASAPVSPAPPKPAPHTAPIKKAPVAQTSYIPTHALTDSDEDPKQFEAELAALPNYCRISDYAVAPDNTMAGDMAYRRLSDLTNSDKYAMKIGGGTQKVLNVQVSTTNLTINYQNDISALLGGSSKMDFYWEDVSSAHCDAIYADSSFRGESAQANHVARLGASQQPPPSFYQLTVLVNDAKHPLIVQCAKALDMQRLVSALDNYLRAARLPALPLGGMPYPQPGLRLNDKSEVTLLWANSPAGKAGVAVKDIVWSLEKNNANPTDKKLLETQLRALNPGTHPLFLVKPADWTKAQIAQSMNQSTRFNPKRQMVSLLVL